MQIRLLPLLLLVFTFGGRAESTKSYSITGFIIALTDSVITIQSGDQTWEITRTAATKADGKFAVGNRVTVHYRMSADRVDVKDIGEKSSPSSTEKADKAAQKAAERAERKPAK